MVGLLLDEGLEPIGEMKAHKTGEIGNLEGFGKFQIFVEDFHGDNRLGLGDFPDLFGIREGRQTSGGKLRIDFSGNHTTPY